MVEAMPEAVRRGRGRPSKTKSQGCEALEGFEGWSLAEAAPGTPPRSGTGPTTPKKRGVADISTSSLDATPPATAGSSPLHATPPPVARGALAVEEMPAKRHCSGILSLAATPVKEAAQASSGTLLDLDSIDAAATARKPDLAGAEAMTEEFSADFDRAGIPSETRQRLTPLLLRWGKARTSQILGLWSFLGDGVLRPVSASTLQVWGPEGTGKTAVVSDYLTTLKIKHIRLNCATFTTLGELNTRLVELLRRTAVDVAGAQVGELPGALQRSSALGQQVRSLDKLESLIRVPLQTLSRSNGGSCLLSASDIPQAPVKVVVVLDHAQELPRLGPGSIEFLINLPEVLQWGNQLAVVVVGRLRLASLGLHPNREPPAVAFQAYTEVEAEAALIKVLAPEFYHAQGCLAGADDTGAPKSILAPPDVCSGLIKFAWPHLGRNLQQLLSVGRQLLRDGLPGDLPGGACGAAFQRLVLRAVQQRLGVCDLSVLLRKTEGMDTSNVSAVVTLQQMTKAEMRLILAAYLAGYVEKEDDLQLFMPEVRRKGRRRMSAKQSQAEALPVYTRPPRPSSMSRLLAVYHRLARKPQLLGPPIFEHLAGLREAGLLRFPAERACLDQDVKVTCRAKLPLVRAIASELNIDLAEYLTKY